MRGMYRFMHEVGNKLTQELITNAEKKIDFEYKVEFEHYAYLSHLIMDILILGQVQFLVKCCL